MAKLKNEATQRYLEGKNQLASQRHIARQDEAPVSRKRKCGSVAGSPADSKTLAHSPADSKTVSANAIAPCAMHPLHITFTQHT